MLSNNNKSVNMLFSKIKYLNLGSDEIELYIFDGWVISQS